MKDINFLKIFFSEMFEFQEDPEIAEDYFMMTTVSIPVYDRRESTVSNELIILFFSSNFYQTGSTSFVSIFKNDFCLLFEQNCIFYTTTTKLNKYYNDNYFFK